MGSCVLTAMVETGDDVCKGPGTAPGYKANTGYKEASAVTVPVVIIHGVRPWLQPRLPLQVSPPESICKAAHGQQHLFPGILQQEKILAFGAESR